MAGGEDVRRELVIIVSFSPVGVEVGIGVSEYGGSGSFSVSAMLL